MNLTLVSITAPAGSAAMRHPASTCSSRAAAPGRPKQGPTLPQGRSPYSASGVLS